MPVYAYTERVKLFSPFLKIHMRWIIFVLLNQFLAQFCNLLLHATEKDRISLIGKERKREEASNKKRIARLFKQCTRRKVTPVKAMEDINFGKNIVCERLIFTTFKLELTLAGVEVTGPRSSSAKKVS